ncbi:MAG: metallophosphoesterase, partial [Candidatus Eisenbacteria bacterium]|nr:metallophosphoesterase [Candidatus Eisenbacteria bacterium]
MGTRLSRRSFLTCAGSAVIGAGVYGLAWGPRDLRVAEASVAIRGLPDTLAGLRIAQISDLHRGRWVSEGQIRRAGDVARSLDPDLVVLTGDYVTGRASYVWSCVEALGPIPSRFGTFAVLGNHDWWTDAGVVRRALQRIDAYVLSNDAVRLGHDGARLWLLGVEDMWSSAFSLARAVYAAGDGAPRILLCHNPDVFAAAAAWGIDLVLSG